ncbi:hypothetical protein [Chitinophaga japonensis]|uniref:Uncharacterized protein DUF4138 n=1 Tax=Chitinophaga japonensis TaxID=104662 RepID=A0A562T5X9_CHIJA|nr:hypothetical protein [Chitinophaga japonensis]TWI88654.1 uncharacterized protein DUF4138 [Chitinophaga japonensis]
MIATTGHVTVGACLGIMLAFSSRPAMAQARSSIDTILTTRGAATLISCAAPVSTFQIGDGKNADYDYRIVDGNLVFIRPTSTMPRTTNLIVREGSNIHYLILAYRDKVDLTRLKYTLSGAAGAEEGAEATAEAAVVKGSDGGQIAVISNEEAVAEFEEVDTVTVGRIAADFAAQQKGGHQYETKINGVSLSFSNAMLLNEQAYFCYRVRNRSKQPYNLLKVTMMYKDSKEKDRLYTMPVLYKKAPSAIPAKDDQQLVFVVPSRTFKRNDEVIVVLRHDTGKQQQLVLYTPVNALPKYMISQ